MSVVDWVCKKISLESASEQLWSITISHQQVLPSKLDACANVTTCCLRALACHRRGLGSNPRSDSICKLSLLLVPTLAPRAILWFSLLFLKKKHSIWARKMQCSLHMFKLTLPIIKARQTNGRPRLRSLKRC